MDYIALRKIKFGNVTYNVGDIIPYAKLANSNVYALLQRKDIQFAGSGGGGGGSWATSETLTPYDPEGENLTTISLGSINPADPVIGVGNKLNDPTGQNGLVQSIDGDNAVVLSIAASGGDSVMWTNQVTVDRANKTITIEATLDGDPYVPEVGFIGFANEDYDTTIFPNNTADGTYQFDTTMWNGTDKFEIKVIPGEGDDPAQEYSDYYFVIPTLSGATYTTSATMAALHTETVFDKADIYETTRDSIKIGDIVINEHLHRTGRVTALNQPFGGSGIIISTAQLPLNDVIQLDLSSLVPVTNPNGGAEDIIFASTTNEWNASSLHAAMHKTPNRIDFSWYYPGWGYDSVIIVDNNGNWGTESVDNDAIAYNASTHILTLKQPQAIVEYVENGGNFAGVTTIEGATETGVKTLTIAEADAVQNFRELHSNDFANVGNVMIPTAVTALFETLKISGASLTVSGNFASLPTNNFFKGIIRKGSSGDIYYEMTDTVTNIRYDAVMPGTATTIDYEPTSIPLKSIEGWNASEAQHLSHDTSGNISWVSGA